MAKKEKKVEEKPVEETPEVSVPEINWEEKFNEEHDSYLRLAAVYDNFRKRNAKEKETLYAAGKAEAV